MCAIFNIWIFLYNILIHWHSLDPVPSLSAPQAWLPYWGQPTCRFGLNLCITWNATWNRLCLFSIKKQSPTAPLVKDCKNSRQKQSPTAPLVRLWTLFDQICKFKTTPNLQKQLAYLVFFYAHICPKRILLLYLQWFH